MSRLPRMGFILSLTIWSGRALAGQQPPPGDAYGNVREGVQLEGYNYVKGPDGQWIYINSDHTGQFNWLLGISRDGDYIRCVFKSNSAYDPLRRAFDIVEYFDTGDTSPRFGCPAMLVERHECYSWHMTTIHHAARSPGCIRASGHLVHRRSSLQ